MADSLATMCSAIALVVAYFAGPMLNFGDFSRYAKSWNAVHLGNFLGKFLRIFSFLKNEIKLGLPVNFLFFSILTVLTTSATKPVFGQLIIDPIEVIDRIGTPFAVIVGGLTFVVSQ